MIISAITIEVVEMLTWCAPYLWPPPLHIIILLIQFFLLHLVSKSKCRLTVKWQSENSDNNGGDPLTRQLSNDLHIIYRHVICIANADRRPSELRADWLRPKVASKIGLRELARPYYPRAR